jgi:hypothetical protein
MSLVSFLCFLCYIATYYATPNVYSLSVTASGDIYQVTLPMSPREGDIINAQKIFDSKDKNGVIFNSLTGTVVNHTYFYLVGQGYRDGNFQQSILEFNLRDGSYQRSSLTMPGRLNTTIRFIFVYNNIMYYLANDYGTNLISLGYIIDNTSPKLLLKFPRGTTSSDAPSVDYSSGLLYFSATEANTPVLYTINVTAAFIAENQHNIILGKNALIGVEILRRTVYIPAISTLLTNLYKDQLPNPSLPLGLAMITLNTENANIIPVAKYPAEKLKFMSYSATNFIHDYYKIGGREIEMNEKDIIQKRMNEQDGFLILLPSCNYPLLNNNPETWFVYDSKTSQYYSLYLKFKNYTLNEIPKNLCERTFATYYDY